MFSWCSCKVDLACKLNLIWKKSKPSCWWIITAVSSRAKSSSTSRLPLKTNPGTDLGTLPQLIIFDKNGTLLNCSRSWASWGTALARKLKFTTGLDLEDKLFQSLDGCAISEHTIQPPDGSPSPLKRRLGQFLSKEGFPPKIIPLLANETWVGLDQVGTKVLDEKWDLEAIFKNLKSRGTKLAVYTTDRRSVTEKELALHQLQGYLDVLVCGDDWGFRPTPHPHQIEVICETLGIEPRDSALIGDAQGDMLMAHHSGVGLIIGVLSGEGTRVKLASYAHNIVDNIEEAVKLLENGNVWIGGNQQRKASLAIFEKVGTLACFNSLWTSWTQEMLKRLEEATGLKLHEKLFSDLGYHGNCPSIFTTNLNRPQSVLGLQELLGEQGLSNIDVADLICRSIAFQYKGLTSMAVPPLDSPAVLFKLLQEQGVKIVVYTSETRWVTEQFLKSVWADQFVDMVVCGDAAAFEKNALEICGLFDVNPSDTVIFGGTGDSFKVSKLSETRDFALPVVLPSKRSEGLVLVTIQRRGLGWPRKWLVDVILLKPRPTSLSLYTHLESR